MTEGDEPQTPVMGGLEGNHDLPAQDPAQQYAGEAEVSPGNSDPYAGNEAHSQGTEIAGDSGAEKQEMKSGEEAAGSLGEIATQIPVTNESETVDTRWDIDKAETIGKAAEEAVDNNLDAKSLSPAEAPTWKKEITEIMENVYDSDPAFYAQLTVGQFLHLAEKMLELDTRSEQHKKAIEDLEKEKQNWKDYHQRLVDKRRDKASAETNTA